MAFGATRGSETNDTRMVKRLLLTTSFCRARRSAMFHPMYSSLGRRWWQLRTAEGNYSLFYTHDGNKNISEVVFCQRASGVVAHYEYAPFGAVISQLGSSAAANPWRFSSEYADDKLGCDYYNYREYESMVGRWLGYDFVADCLNRYVWCENYTGGFDFLGLKLKVFGDPAKNKLEKEARRLTDYVRKGCHK